MCLVYVLPFRDVVLAIEAGEWDPADALLDSPNTPNVYNSGCDGSVDTYPALRMSVGRILLSYGRLETGRCEGESVNGRELLLEGELAGSSERGLALT
jgi:hypothetical protein